MTDKPIIFSEPMILALLAGRKTQTRRLAWRWTVRKTPRGEKGEMVRTEWQRVQPGDRLWVRESWSHDAPDLATARSAFEDIMPGGVSFGPYYRATEVAPETLKWISPIYMPRWASRLTLVVTATKIEPVQNISEEDAIAEGARYFSDIECRHPYPHSAPHWSMEQPSSTDDCLGSAQHAFGNFWNKMQGSGAWDANPEVVCIAFEIKHKIVSAA
jgi:hypothetical protein